jgi:hypothetical protein
MEGAGADVEEGELGAVAAGGVRSSSGRAGRLGGATADPQAGATATAVGGRAATEGEGRRGPRGARRDRRRNSATKLFMVGRGGGRG